MISEDQLIARIAASVVRGRGRGAAGGVRLGIGDDAAIIAAGREAEWVLSCDAFLEGVHFIADLHPPDSVGYKALARATSDLAAMGATPRFFLMTLTLPEKRTGRWLDQFLGGLRRAAREFGMMLIGGDTTEGRAILASITVIGEYPGGARTGVIGKKRGGGLVTRSGARAGDRIYVSGTLGAAQLGLLLLKNEGAKAAKLRPSALKAHLYPRIRVELGAFLARKRVATAMVDISDGLSTDLNRLCAASRVGARIWAERIPCVRVPSEARGRAAQSLAGLKLDPVKLALDGGEDYELLFTVAPRDEKRLRQAPGFEELRQIGEVIRGGKVSVIQKDGTEMRLAPGGWDPFRRI